MKKICVVTATRAEYGLLKGLLRTLKASHEFDLQLIVTGTHLSHEFGLTYQEIEKDGFSIDEKIEILLSSDTSTAVVKSMGLATIEFANTLNRLEPDLIVILGDRYEMLAVAQTALILQIPIAHIHGGENTFGAYDDAIRHSITKMASWHFASTEDHRKRIIQLGEDPSRVFNVGAMGIESIINIPLLEKIDLYKELKLNEEKPFFLITQHAETNGESDVINDLLKVLDEYDVNLVFTKANADNGGREINKKIQDYTEINSDAKLFNSLGQLRYLSACKHADVVIGNSSSGLIEVPYLKTPTVNIGSRQKGRACPNSVFHAFNTVDSIRNAINKANSFKGPYEQIFGDGHATDKIIDVLEDLKTFKIQKEFYDL